MNQEQAKAAMLFYNSIVGIIHQRHETYARLTGLNHLFGHFEVSSSPTEFPNQNEGNLIDMLEFSFEDNSNFIRRFIKVKCSRFENHRGTNTPSYFKNEKEVFMLFCGILNLEYTDEYNLVNIANIIDNA